MPDVQSENDTPLTEEQAKRELQLKVGNLTGAALMNFREAGDPNTFAQAMRPLFQEAIEVGAAYQRRLIPQASTQDAPKADTKAQIQSAPAKGPGSTPVAEKVAPAPTAGQEPAAAPTVVTAFSEDDPNDTALDKAAKADDARIVAEREAAKKAKAAAKNL